MHISSIITEIILLALLILVYWGGRHFTAKSSDKADKGRNRTQRRRQGESRRKETSRHSSSPLDDSLSAFRAEEQRELRESESKRTRKATKEQKRVPKSEAAAPKAEADATAPSQQSTTPAPKPKRKPRHRKPQVKTSTTDTAAKESAKEPAEKPAEKPARKSVKESAGEPSKEPAKANISDGETSNTAELSPTLGEKGKRPRRRASQGKKPMAAATPSEITASESGESTVQAQAAPRRKPRRRKPSAKQPNESNGAAKVEREVAATEPQQ